MELTASATRYSASLSSNSGVSCRARLAGGGPSGELGPPGGGISGELGPFGLASPAYSPPPPPAPGGGPKSGLDGPAPPPPAAPPAPVGPVGGGLYVEVEITPPERQTPEG